MSGTQRSESSDALVLRTAAVWGTFVLASRDLRSGQSLSMGESEGALYAKPDASDVADLPIRAVGSGWELDARGVSGGLLHLRGRREDPSELGKSGAPIPIVPGDYGLLMYGSLSLFFQFAHTAPPPRSRVRVDLSFVLSFLFAVLTIGGSLLLLYMLYPHQELNKPIELLSQRERELEYHVAAPPPEPAPGAEAEGAAGAKAKTPEKAAGNPQRTPGPKRPSPEPPSPGAGGPPASSAMTQVLHGAVGKEVLDTLGTISSVADALGGLESAGLVLGGGSGGVGLRASGDGGGQGGTALFGSGTLDTGFGSGAGVAGNGPGRKGSGSGRGGSGTGTGGGGERRIAAAAVSAPGQGLSPEQISRVVRARSGAFRACYESAAARDPRLQGGITVSFTVSPGGDVAARISNSSLGNARVESCVLRMFNRLRFPAADKPTSANWPLVFRPGK
jgi:outer membrane biosynthesis protein TonB